MSNADFLDDMPDDPRVEIARLETEIERLTETLARCRKIGIAAKIAIILGCILIGAIFGGAIAPEGPTLLLAIILPLGGTVLYGSNDATAKQAAARIETAAKRRAALIEAMDLRVVSEPHELH